MLMSETEKRSKLVWCEKKRRVNKKNVSLKLANARRLSYFARVCVCVWLGAWQIGARNAGFRFMISAFPQRFSLNAGNPVFTCEQKRNLCLELVSSDTDPFRQFPFVLFLVVARPTIPDGKATEHF